VMKGSPAMMPAASAGDVIVAVEAEPIKKAGDLRLKMALTRVGADVRLRLFRKGEPIEVTATLSETAEAQLQIPPEIPLLSGVVLGPADTSTPAGGGASVVAVDPDSPAGRAGLQVGDMILSVDQMPVRTPEDVVSAARHTPDHILLQLRRDDGMLFIVVS
jgi:S1-C subfamily serine protease